MSTLVSWKPAPLKRFLSKNDSGVWGDEPTGVDDCLVLRSTDITLDGWWAVQNPAWRSLEPRESRQALLREGDLVVVKSSGSAAHLGKTALVTDDVAEMEARFANFVQRLRAAANAYPRYLWYLLNSSFAKRQLELLGTTTTGLRNLNAELIGSIECPGPPLHEQCAIADFLDAETARIDALIAKKRRMRQLLGERIAAHVEQKTRASSISMVKDDPLPERWRLVVLRRCFELIQYGIGEASREVGTIAVLGMGNVDHGEIVGNPGGFVDQIDPSLLLEPGDLLFNRTNSLALVGKVALVRDSMATTFASYLVRLRTNHLADSAYLNYLLNTRPVLEQARSMALPSIGQANLNPSRYTSIRVPLPPVQIQRSIVSELDLEAATHNRLSSALVRQIDLLTEHRQALITAAVTGQLEVPGAVAR